MYRMLEKETQAAALSTAACSFIFRNVFYKLRYNIKIITFMVYFAKYLAAGIAQKHSSNQYKDIRNLHFLYSGFCIYSDLLKDFV